MKYLFISGAVALVVMLASCIFVAGTHSHDHTDECKEELPPLSPFDLISEEE